MDRTWRDEAIDTIHYHKLRNRHEDLPNDAKTGPLMTGIIRHTNLGMDIAVLLHVVVMRDMVGILIPRKSVLRPN
jgi:hypothetical protein